VIKLGDTVLYTTPELSVHAAIVVRVHADGSVDLCEFPSIERIFYWPRNVKVSGAQPGTEEAAGFWSPK
jgi:hypothetical protein